MSISVVGFDVGNATSYVALAKKGGIETAVNDYSDRCTHTCVGFTDSLRMLGTSAKLQQITNFKRTFANFVPLIGKDVSDEQLIYEKPFCSYPIDSDEDGRPIVNVNFREETISLSPEQLMCMHLNKLKDIAELNVNAKVIDIVLNVPTYYTDRERRALLDAVRIAGLNCVKLVNDVTAVGTNYGLSSRVFPEVDKPPMHVAFVIVGYTSTQVAVCAFNTGKMKVIATASNPHLGGRNFDHVLATHFAKEFQQKHKLDIFESKRSVLRMLAECEKVKKVLSANSSNIPVNMECLMEDLDFSSKINREEFENLSSDLIVDFEKVLKLCLSRASVNTEEISSVELVGGSIRIPVLQRIVQSVFGQEGKSTLNQDEAVARGCALQAAILSPAFKVKDFTVTDLTLYPILLKADQKDISSTASDIEADASEESLVIPEMFPIPCSRQITLNRNGPFTFEARYGVTGESVHDNKLIGVYKIDVPVRDEASKVRIKLRMNTHGIFTVARVQLQEEYEKEVEVEVPKEKKTDESSPMDTEPTATNGDAEVENESTAKSEATDTEQKNSKQPETEKVKQMKKFTKLEDLAIDSNTAQYSTAKLNELTELEGKMCALDKQEIDRCTAKNAVEEYVYDMRSNLRGRLCVYVNDAIKSKLLQALDETETWLYGDGENLLRQAYADRLAQLRQLGDPIANREKEEEGRGPAIKAFETELNQLQQLVSGIAAGEEAYDHLSDEQIGKLKSCLDENLKWLKTNLSAQSKKSQHDDPSFKVADVISKHQSFHNVCRPILSTPKPTPPAPTVEEPASNGTSSTANNSEAGDAASSSGASDSNSAKQAHTPEKTAPTPVSTSNHMEVD